MSRVKNFDQLPVIERINIKCEIAKKNIDEFYSRPTKNSRFKKPRVGKIIKKEVLYLVKEFYNTQKIILGYIRYVITEHNPHRDNTYYTIDKYTETGDIIKTIRLYQNKSQIINFINNYIDNKVNNGY